MESAAICTSKQKSVLGLLLPIFEETPRIQPRLVTLEYQRLTRKNFSLRAYGFQGNEDLVHKLNVFDHHDGGAISVSESKLFDLLLLPLLNMRLFPHQLDDAFVKNNGFRPAILCRYSKVENLEQLVEKYTSSASSVQADAFRSPGFVESSFGNFPSLGSSRPLLPTPVQQISYSSSLFYQGPVPPEPPVAAVSHPVQWPTLWPIQPSPRPPVHSNSPTEHSDHAVILKEPPSAVTSITSKQKSVLGLLLPFFEQKPQVPSGQMTQEYQRLTRSNFSPRSFDFRTNDKLIAKLNVFDHHDGTISLSKSKLLKLLVHPLSALPPHEMGQAFVEANGFEPNILCQYFKVENLQQLAAKCVDSAASDDAQVDTTAPAPQVEPFCLVRRTPPLTSPLLLTPPPSQRVSQEHPQLHLPVPPTAQSQQAQHDLHPQPLPIASQPHPTPSPSLLYPLVSHSDALPREACTTEHVNVCSTKQKSVLAFLMPLFQSLPRIKPQRLAHQYQSHYRANFSPRSFGFGGIDDLIAKLGVFDKDGSSISLSESKLLSLLVHPLLTDHQPPLEQAFERENGFKSTILCKYCKVKTLQQLVAKCVGSATAVQADNSAHLPLTTEPVTSYTTDFPPLGYAGPSPPKRAVNTFFQEQAPGFTASHHLQPYPPLPQTHQQVSQAHPPLSQTHQPVTSPHPSIERYPNSDVPLREETFLPALPSVRKDMEAPKSSSQLRFPSFSKRETKQQAQEKLEVYLQNHIAHLSQQRKHLPADVVITFTKQSVYKANNMLGRQLFKWTDIQCASNFSKCYSRVSEFIRCFCWNTTITSLFELRKAILILEECSSFDDLQMGPILTHPLVKDLFKPPADVISVPEITGYDIQTQLATFIYKYKKGTKYNLPDFLNYFAEQQSVSDPDHLCIRISSFPLALSVSSI